MPYASKQDMIDRFGEPELIQISDRDGSGTLNDQTLEQAQMDGDAEIDAYLRPLYRLPLEVVPTNLVRIACDIYRYYMYGALVPDYAEKRHKLAIDTLKLINSGKLDLTLNAEEKPAPEPLVSTRPGVAASVFNESALRGY